MLQYLLGDFSKACTFVEPKNESIFLFQLFCVIPSDLIVYRYDHFGRMLHYIVSYNCSIYASDSSNWDYAVLDFGGMTVCWKHENKLAHGFLYGANVLTQVDLSL